MAEIEENIHIDESDEEEFEGEEMEDEEEEEDSRDSQGIIMIAQMITNVDSAMDTNQIKNDLRELSLYGDVSDWRGFVRFFDTLLSVTSLVSNYHDWNDRHKIVDSLISCFHQLKDSVIEHVRNVIDARSNGEKIPRDGELVNGLVIFVVITHRISVQLQNHCTQILRDKVAGTAGRKGKRPDLDGELENFVKVQRIRLINCLIELLKLEVEVNGQMYKNCVEYVWKPNVMDPEFLKVFSDTVYALIADPDCMRCSSQPWLRKLFLIIKSLVIDYNKTEEMARLFLDKTLSLEYLTQATPTFPFIEPLLNDNGNNHPNIQLFLERVTLGAFAITQCNNISLKPVGVLIQALSEHYPEVLLKNNFRLLSLLESAAHTVRSCALTALNDLLKSELLTDQICRKYENRKKQRDTIYKKLMSHIQDENMLLRRAAVGHLAKLMEAGVIPAEVQSSSLITLMARRLNDKSAQVRKGAVQFLALFLRHNKFGRDFEFKINADHLYSLIRNKATMENPKESLCDEFEKKFRSKSDALQAQLRARVDEHMAGIVTECPELETYKLNSDYDVWIRQVLESPGPISLILMYIYAERNELPFVDANADPIAEKQRIFDILYERILDDYVRIELRTFMAVEENSVLTEQRFEDYLVKQAELACQIEMCANKLIVEEQLGRCVQSALRLVLMGDTSEMKEAIKFITKCEKFNIRGAKTAVRSMCSLVWRNSNDVRKELMDAAMDIFISRDSEKENVKQSIRDAKTVSNCMKMMQGIDECDRVSVEEVIYLLAKKDEFTKGVIQELWTTVSSINRDVSVRVDALRILYAISRSPNGVTESRHRLRTIQRILTVDPALAYEALRVVSVLNTPTNPDDLNAPVFQIPTDDTFVQSLEQLFVHEILRDTDDQNWFGIVQMTIAVLINVVKDVNVMLPRMAGVLLFRAQRASEFYLFYKKKAESENPEDEDKRRLAPQRRDYWACLWIRIMERLMAFIGEVAVKVHAHIQLNIPRIHAIYQAKMRNAHSNDSSVVEEAAKLLNEFEMCVGKKKFMYDYSLETQQGESDTFINHMIQNLSSGRILSKSKLLGRLLPIALYASRARHMPNRIRDAASFTVGKYMTLSDSHSELCGPLFFTLMSKSPYPLVRMNMLAACSDFAFAQPNLFELYAPTLYRMTSDVDAATRESAILVLSHLMSNDMIQVRGALFEPARCIADNVEAVAKIAHSFFKDLNQRSDALVNLLPEFLYRLACTGEKLPMAKYERIVDNLIKMIRDKSRQQADTMIERVCAKFGTMESSNNPQSSKCFAYALEKFTLTDGSFVKLRDAIRHWSRFLNHKAVANSLNSLLTAFMKSTKSDELKRDAEELWRKIERIQNEGLTTDVLTLPAPTPKRGVKNRKPVAKTTSTAKKRARKPAVFSDDSEFSD